MCRGIKTISRPRKNYTAQGLCPPVLKFLDPPLRPIVCMLGMEGKDRNKFPCELRFPYVIELTLSCRSNFCKPRKRKSILQNPCIMESAPTVLKISRPDSWYSLAMMNPKTMMTGLSTQARTKRA